MASIPKITKEVIENKKKAKELKEKGNIAFTKKKYEEAEVGFLNLVRSHLEMVDSTSSSKTLVRNAIPKPYSRTLVIVHFGPTALNAAM